jgi:hypothetical protein
MLEITYGAVTVLLGSQFVLKALALITTSSFTVRGETYWVEDSVGTEPLVVYRITAPDVEQEIETVCGVLYVLGAGEKTGSATTGMIVYVAVLSELIPCPMIQPFALRTVVELSVIGD